VWVQLPSGVHRSAGALRNKKGIAEAMPFLV